MGYTKALEGAAYTWWCHKRPRGWTEGKHLRCPWANCQDDHERELALTVAEWVAAKLLQRIAVD
jgi:hypothetical protein